jgi:hypothetical protein
VNLFAGIIRLPAPKPLEGWPCPACGGLGRGQDGYLHMHADGSSEVKLGTKCGTCGGKGRVKLVPID